MNIKNSNYFRGEMECSKSSLIKDALISKTKASGRFVDEAIILKDISRLFIENTLNKFNILEEDYISYSDFMDQIPDFVEQGFIGTLFDGEKQKKAIWKKMTDKSRVLIRAIFELYNSGNRIYTPAMVNNDNYLLKISDDIGVNCSCDFYVESHTKINAVIIRNGANNIKKKLKEDVNEMLGTTEQYLLELWLGCQSAKSAFKKQYGDGNKLIKEVTSSYFFLGRKSNESDEDDMFATNTKDQYKYIVSYSNGLFASNQEITDFSAEDRKNLSFISHYLRGISEEQCSEDQCKRCINFLNCIYAEPPKKVILDKEEKEEKSKVNAAIKYSDEQKAIIDSYAEKNAIFRVNAGAGTGKTECVTERTKRYIISRIKNGENISDVLNSILCLSFTEVAASEMAERICKKLLAEGIEVSPKQLHCKTFHSFALPIIQSEGLYQQLGYTKSPSVANEKVIEVIKYLIDTSDYSFNGFNLISPNNNKFYFSQGVRIIVKKLFEELKAIQYEDGLTVDEVVQDVPRKRIKNLPLALRGNNTAFEKIKAMYPQFCYILKRNDIIEYNDMEGELLQLLNNNPIAEQLGYKYICVDEFQDSNPMQILILKELEKQCENLMVVGDDSQGARRS